MIELASLVAYLDDYLEIDEPPDSPGAENGLQVENSGKVDSIVACTDACLETISAAAERGANLMLVHHGLFWGKGITPLTGRRYDRIRLLLEADIALYSAHIPLDIHPEVGNNAELARLLGVRVSERFGDYDGCKIGVAGDLEIRRDELAARLEELLDHRPRVLAGGGERCRRIGIVTGGAGSLIAEAHEAGLDTFITGEGLHHTYFDAEELGMNVFFAGHYATETLGVKALAEHLSKKFSIRWEFVDHPTGL